MIIEILKETFTTVLSDLGVVGWGVIGIYVIIFGLSIMSLVIDYKDKSEHADLLEKRQEVRARIDEINLRLAEIRLARSEEEEKLRLEAAEAREKQKAFYDDLNDIADELEDYEDEFDFEERQQIIAEMEAEEAAIQQELQEAENEEINDESKESWVIK